MQPFRELYTLACLSNDFKFTVFAYTTLETVELKTSNGLESSSSDLESEN